MVTGAGSSDLAAGCSILAQRTSGGCDSAGLDPPTTIDWTRASHWQSEVLRAQEQQALASAALKRETLLWQDGIIAEKRVIEARSMLAHATLNLTQSRQRLALMGASTHPKQLSSQLTIHSPHQGTVSELLVSLGQYVEAGTPIAKVVRSSKLALELYATMAQSQQVRVGIA